VLTTTYNADNQTVSVKVETPVAATSNTPVVAEANLTTNEVTVNDQSVVAADLSAPVETVSLTATQAPAKEESTQAVSEVTEAIASASEAPAYAETEQPVADAIDHVTSSAEETLAKEEAPATKTSAQAETTEVVAHPEAATSKAASEAPESSEAPSEQLVATSETASEAPSEQLAATSEAAPAASEAPASVAPVATSEAAPAASEAPAPAAETHKVSAASTPNTYPVGQCTWGAKSLAPWAGNNWGNAKDWIASAQAAGHSVGTTPVAGAIAVWPNDGGGYGHVAYVTSASGVNSIQVMESNYAGNMLIGNYRGIFDPTSSAHGGSVFYIYP
ncbi:MAG: CHAP domain-containing protein, partial [Streptococcus vestibularis]|nr:CHAP domain-containing protein [Streptococcus vestibularis]